MCLYYLFILPIIVFVKFVIDLFLAIGAVIAGIFTGLVAYIRSLTKRQYPSEEYDSNNQGLIDAESSDWEDAP